MNNSEIIKVFLFFFFFMLFKVNVSGSGGFSKPKGKLFFKFFL